MSFGELAGYVASALVFTTFYMKTMMRLRIVAIVSNVAFIVYAVSEGLLPVLILHVSLLPLNIIRLREFANLVQQTRSAARGDISFEALLPFMSAAKANAGETLFSKGDHSDEMFYICEGRVHLPEIGKTVGAGETLGEIGLFSEDRLRMTSAVCETDCELLSISEEKFLQLYNQNPRFGFFIVRVITRRLIENYDRIVQSLTTNPAETRDQVKRMTPEPTAMLDEKRPAESAAPAADFGQRRRMRTFRTGAAFTAFLVMLALAWQAAPYLRSLFVRDGVVTAWSNLATAPIDGTVIYAAAPLNQPVGADGIVARIANDHLSRAKLDAAEIAVRRAKLRVEETRAFLSEVQALDDDRATAKSQYADEFRSQLDTEIVNQEAEIATAKLQLGVMKKIAERSAELAEQGTVSQNRADEAELRVTELEVRIAGMESDLRDARFRRKAADSGTFITGAGTDPNWVFDWRMDLKVAKKAARLDQREAEADLAAAEAALAAATTDFERLSRAQVTVPPGSLVWNRRTASGATVRAGDPVVEWVDCTILLIDVPIPTVELPLVREGMAAELWLDGDREPRHGEVVLTRGRSSNFTRSDLVATATDQDKDAAEILIGLSSDSGEFSQCPVGRSASVNLPDIEMLDVLRVWLRL